MGKTKDLGHLAHIVAYDAENNITVPAGITMHTNQLVASQSWVTTALGSYALSSSLSSYVPTSRTITINGTSYDLSANREWTVGGADSTKLPLAGGTLTGPLNGTSAFFTGNLRTDTGLGLKYGSFVSTSGYLNLFSAIIGSTMTLNLKDGTGGYEIALTFPASANRSYTFPSANGTIALTSDIPSLSGYVPTSRTITINGTAYDLTANRSWTVTATETDTLATVTARGASTSTPVVFTGNMAAWNATTPGLGLGTIQLGAANGTSNFGAAITFAARDGGGGTNAQAGIYVTSDGAYGTRMYFATTDSYVTGSKTAMSISETGQINFPRALVQVTGYLRTAGVTSNTALWASGASSADFGNVLGQGTSSRSTFFRGNTNNVSVWWGGIDANGANVPYGAIDAVAGEFNFWRNSGGTGGGAWTNIMTMNASGLTINSGNFIGNLTGTASAVAWGNVSSKPSHIMYYQSFTLDANTMDANATGFTYSVNAPYTGPIVRFSAGGSYDLQLNANYGNGTSIAYRTRNGDAGAWNSWYSLISSANIGSQSVSYATTAGSSTSASSATYLNSSNYIQRTGSSGNANTDFQNTPAGTYRYQGDDAGLTNGAGNSWWFYENYRHSNGSNYWGTQVAWGWEDNANRLATRNVSANSFGGWVYYLNSSNFTSYIDAPNRVGYSYYQTNTWIQFNGNYGLYWPNNYGLHFYPNTNGSYGAAQILGTKNDWRGLHFGEGTGMTLMMNETEFGFHRQAVGWTARFTSGTGHFNISGQAASIVSQANSATINATSGNAGNNIVLRDGAGDIAIGTLNTNHAYFGTGGRGLTSADTYGSYGNVHTYGTGQNGYSGYGIRTAAGYRTFFMAEGANYGIYAQDLGKWAFYYSSSTASYAIGSSDAVSGYTLYLIYGLYTVGLYNASDARMKKDIKPLSSSLDKVKQLRGVSYEYIDKGEDGTKNKGLELGFIAQEVLPVIPELIRYDEKKGYAMNYNGVSAVLVEAIKEQQVQIENQQNQINTLISQLTELLNK